MLDKDVLRGMLPLRAAAARERARSFDAQQRERAFRAHSRSYASALAGAEPDARMRRITIDSVPWWVPITTPDDPAAVARALKHQNLPYLVLTQTREVSVGGLMLDIGANTGRMSIPRVLLGDVTAAYCAEPEPLNYSCLVRTVTDNGLTGLVLPDRVAIGSANGVARLKKAKSTGGHRIVDGGAHTHGDVIDVPSLTLDTWVERLGIDVGQLVFVKVDTQGCEVEVLRGARKLLACPHVAWQIEVDAQTLDNRGFTTEDLFRVLQQHVTHFVDLGRQASGARVRPIDELSDALSYVSGPSGSRTDLLAFTLSAPTQEQPLRNNP